MSSIYEHKIQMADGSNLDMSAFEGKLLLFVNTASKCGFTPQYEELEQLHREYGDKGLVIIGFPCNQFGAQEPGDEAEILNFCSLTYDVSFPLAKKIDVNGENASALWKYLKSQQAGLLGSRAIKWNFTKFLVDKKGDVVARYGPQVKPKSLAPQIEKLLA
ncbi:glutathione peroxidase [Sphingorhabdus lutea]|uniref:Glutathione peroxidase n=1 Tax=Sphingorhabdus lutea TaxID=1913578 RepID=A0A1L3JBV8_9SPHN|nr:glutathione peroxidase [Sphingorhabdus lutea]APG62624.1 glutathione peroxidase [Sphingorhabdus lutea]